MTEMIEGYLQAIALLEKSIDRVREGMKAATDVAEKAQLSSRYTKLCDTRRDLVRIVDYITNYYGRRFYGSQSWRGITESDLLCKGGCECRIWHMGGHQIADRSAETPDSDCD